MQPETPRTLLQIGYFFFLLPLPPPRRCIGKVPLKYGVVLSVVPDYHVIHGSLSSTVEPIVRID